jgi:hypothetical protein
MQLRKSPHSIQSQGSLTRLHLSLSRFLSIQSTPPTDFLNSHFNIIHPSTPKSSKWPLSLRFSQQNLPSQPTSATHAAHVINKEHCIVVFELDFALRLTQLQRLQVHTMLPSSGCKTHSKRGRFTLADLMQFPLYNHRN